jgi:hypothetical protein
MAGASRRRRRRTEDSEGGDRLQPAGMGTGTGTGRGRIRRLRCPRFARSCSLLVQDSAGRVGVARDALLHGESKAKSLPAWAPFVSITL